LGTIMAGLKLRKRLRRLTAREIARVERVIQAWNGSWLGDYDVYLDHEKLDTAWPSARYQIKDFVKHTVLRQERVIRLDQKIEPGDIIQMIEPAEIVDGPITQEEVDRLMKAEENVSIADEPSQFPWTVN
jgi:hypothetical protein